MTWMHAATPYASFTSPHGTAGTAPGAHLQHSPAVMAGRAGDLEKQAASLDAQAESLRQQAAQLRGLVAAAESRPA